MITYEQFHQIKALQARELTAGQIASQTGLSPNTVRLWMKRDSYEVKRDGRRRVRKLDAYKPRIAQLLREYERYTGVQMSTDN